MMENSKIRILALEFARNDRMEKINEKAMIRNWYYQITHLIQNTKRKWKQTEEVMFQSFV